MAEFLDEMVSLKADDYVKMLDEIERLRIALALAVGEMSTSGEYSYLSPEALMNKFLEEARRG